MNAETLEFPEIAEAPAMPRTEVAVAAAGAIDLKKLDLTAVALAQFGDWRAATSKLKADNTKTVLDLSTQSKIDDAISLRQRTIKQPLADARKVEKALKSKLSETSKAVAAELVLLEAAYADASSPMTTQIETAQKKIDDEKEAERQAKEKRLQDLRNDVDALLAKWLQRCSAEGMTAERIKKGIQGLELVPTPPDAMDVATYWREKKSETLREMDRLMLEAQRAENDRADAERREREQQQAMAMQEIQGIQQQVIIAQAGRLGVRAGGTIECIRDTLAETEAWTLDAERFGDLLGLAEMTKAAAIIQIKAMLERAEAAAAAEIEAARLRAITPAANVATAAATLGTAETPEPGTLEAAPITAAMLPTESALNEPEAPSLGDSQGSSAGSDCGVDSRKSQAGSPVETRQPITQDAQESGFSPADAPACTSSEADTAQASLCGDEGPARAENSAPVSAWPYSTSRQWFEQKLRENTTSEAAPQQASDHPTPEADAAPGGTEDHSPGIDAQLARDALDFVRGFLSAFDTKFPTHPKPGPDWWRAKRAEGEALQSQLVAAIGEGA